LSKFVMSVVAAGVHRPGVPKHPLELPLLLPELLLLVAPLPLPLLELLVAPLPLPLLLLLLLLLEAPPSPVTAVVVQP
jgi:hypothetical protein